MEIEIKEYNLFYIKIQCFIGKIILCGSSLGSWSREKSRCSVQFRRDLIAAPPINKLRWSLMSKLSRDCVIFFNFSAQVTSRNWSNFIFRPNLSPTWKTWSKTFARPARNQSETNLKTFSNIFVEHVKYFKHKYFVFRAKLVEAEQAKEAVMQVCYRFNFVQTMTTATATTCQQQQY